MVNATTDTDVDLVYASADNAFGGEACDDIALGESLAVWGVIDDGVCTIPAEHAIEIAVAYLQRAAPWKLR